MAWHRLDPWPDSVAGLTRLKRKFILATMSNGNVKLMVDMAKHSGLPWDMILEPKLHRATSPTLNISGWMQTLRLLQQNA